MDSIHNKLNYFITWPGLAEYLLQVKSCHSATNQNANIPSTTSGNFQNTKKIDNLRATDSVHVSEFEWETKSSCDLAPKAMGKKRKRGERDLLRFVGLNLLWMLRKPNNKKEDPHC